METKQVSPKLLWPLTTLLLATACQADTVNETTRVVASTSIWGQVVHGVVGEDAEVTVLMPVGADAHDFQMSSSQAALVATADLVIVNGLGLEEGMQDALEAAVEEGANVLEVGESLDPMILAEGEIDPHVWMDPLRVARAAELVAEGMTSLGDEVDWNVRAEVVTARMVATDVEIQQILAVVPVADRKLVTNHEALGYFADRYGFEVIGSVIPGPTTLDQPSSAELAALVATMREAGVAVVFAETSDSAALAEAVAAELGQETRVVALFTESLGPPGSGADTVAGMLLTNARLIADALVR
jgi:zinc/manganese transport system substrate-binding protein